MAIRGAVTVREHSTVRRQPDLQRAAAQGSPSHDLDPHDDDLFADGDARRRERLLSLGTMKPESHNLDLPRFVRASEAPPLADAAGPSPPFAAAQAADDVPRRPVRQAWIFGLLGFICGIGFWHAIGFWGFINAIVLPPQRPAQVASGTDAPAAAQPPGNPSYQPARPTRAKP
jgi:hypothetical protein